jgi:hypothetical protein
VRREFPEGRPASIPTVTSDRAGKETNQVNRQVKSVAVFMAAALLFGAAVTGCARPGGATTAPASSAAATQAAQTDPIANATPIPTPVATAVVPTPTGAADAAATAPANAAAPTTDPLDGTFSSLDQLLSGVNGALPGSDAGISGGE